MIVSSFSNIRCAPNDQDDRLDDFLEFIGRRDAIESEKCFD